MGCTASTAAAPHPVAASGVATQPVQVRVIQPRQQPLAPAAQRPTNAATNSPHTPHTPTAPNTLTTAPLVRSLVSLKRETCALEHDASGWHLKFDFSSVHAGKAVVNYLVRGGDATGIEKALPIPSSALSSSELSFLATGSTAQSGRLFLCTDLPGSLAEFSKEPGSYHVMLDLLAESSDSTAVTALRTFLKLPLDGIGEVHVEKQLVQIGAVVRQLDALYGTLPNPKVASNNLDADGGECVICLANPREVAILHCRHVCLCLSCAQITSSTWSFQCPVCRGRVAAMVGLKIQAPVL